VIHTEEENEHYVAALEALHDRGHLTPEEELLSETLTAQIEHFENKHYKLEPAGPIDIIRELMDANGLKQSGMIDVFGTKSVASGVLSANRDLSKATFRSLPSVFMSRRTYFSRPRSADRRSVTAR
jgi:HTH-type transcriptional regulator/antitoxin HigA